MRQFPAKANIMLALSLLLWAVALLHYFIDGYSGLVLTSWLTAIVAVGFYFYLKEKEKIKTIKVFDTQDWLIAVILVLMFLPLHLFFLNTIPFQVNTDEIAIGFTAKNVISQPIDIFGFNSYWGYPNLIFYIWGWGAQIMGGITLLHLRFMAAFCSLIIIFLSYFFFRALSLSKLYAFSGATIIGAHHALLGLSRIGIFNDTLLIVEFAALAILYIGWERRSLFYTFLGGLAAGFSFYTYFTARIIFVVWLFFLFISYFLSAREQKKATLKIAAIGMIGFMMIVAPIGLATIKAPSIALSNFWHPFTVFSDGQELAKNWSGAPTVAEGLKINFVNGLLMFIGNQIDKGMMYVNYGHGFLDIFSRILLWCGVIVVAVRLISKSKPEVKYQDLLALVCFLFLWLFFTLLTTKNPAYLRMFSILPFIVYLILAALEKIVKVFSKILKVILNDKKVSLFCRCLFFGFVVCIIVFNINIYKDYVIAGFEQGDVVGGTGRYVEDRKHLSNYVFLIAASNDYSYYGWGPPDYWKDWARFFADHRQIIEVIDPQGLLSIDKITAVCSSKPMTLFLNRALYSASRNTISAACGQYQAYNITPDGRLLALEFLH